MVRRFPVYGKGLEPCRGSGNIYRAMKRVFRQLDWCEIDQGRDFFDYREPVDWIFTNPPYSIYDPFLLHCFSLADNVVLLIPLHKVFKSLRVIEAAREYGGAREIIVLGGGGVAGFPFGFPVGIVWLQRDYRGPIHLEGMASDA